MIDYIIVGAGLGGITFSEIALLSNKKVFLINDDSQNSSLVAAGLYNPVILKRFTLAPDAERHLSFIIPFYQKIEHRFNIKFMFKMPLYRRFFSAEEQNDWFIAADKPGLNKFLSSNIVRQNFKNIQAPFGYGEVLHTGYVDTSLFLKTYKQYLKSSDDLLQESFDFSLLSIDENHVQYKNIKAKHIVFAEGFGMLNNPFFNYLPLDGTKGELLIIKAPDLKLDVAINSGVFILPIGNDLYRVGATYQWKDKTPLPTSAGLNELTEKLEELISCEYEIVDHLAGVRPTVRDRNPLVGTHPDYKNVHILNGLGTRGVMIGPPLAQDLFNYIEYGMPIVKNTDISRFKK